MVMDIIFYRKVFPYTLSDALERRYTKQHLKEI